MQRTETFLREWFSKDESALKDIDNGHFTIGNTSTGSIPPDLWERVVGPDAHIAFSRQLPPEVPAPLPSLAQNTDPDDRPETHYENRIQYKVTYLRRHEYGGRSEFVRQKVYSEPVELEVTQEYERLPALEELKTIESPPDETVRAGDLAKRTAKAKLPKLRQADFVGEPVLKIHSPYLLNILKSVIECSAELPMGDNKGLDAGLFMYPYMDLYLYLEDLLKYKTNDFELRKRHSQTFNRLADEHIDLLQSYLGSQSSVHYHEAKKRSSGSTPLTTFGTYWLLMKPGTDVYVREMDGSLNRYVLDRLSGGVGRDSKGNKVTLKYTALVWNLILDEKAIRQYPRLIDIQVFDDERMITELPVFPAQYHDKSDNGSTHRALIDRGQKYFAYSKKPCFLQYDGQGLKPGSRTVSIQRGDAEGATDGF